MANYDKPLPAGHDAKPLKLSARPVMPVRKLVQGGGGMSGQDRNYYYYLADGQ
ncbi:MAG: hypothetical protein JWO25_1445 [Alphaproteobacteria bacterium]|nr:hypothetical protein [Alphaproteobacteria bacterium]